MKGPTLEQNEANFFRRYLVAPPVVQIVLQVTISDAELEGLQYGWRFDRRETGDGSQGRVHTTWPKTYLGHKKQKHVYMYMIVYATNVETPHLQEVLVFHEI